MQKLGISINVRREIFIKDPCSTDLGKKILELGIQLIDHYGLEDFNFKKLAQKIGSTESSIYRYFENKHTMFIYLINWYWEWTSTRIDIAQFNIQDPYQKLENIINALIETSYINVDIPYIDEETLHRIVVREGTKAYHHKLVDDENSTGFFLAYKNLCKKISEVLLEINPEYEFPKALASTLLESCNNNIYFARHLPRLTDIKNTEDPVQLNRQLSKFLTSLVLRNLNNHHSAKEHLLESYSST